jgi:predicted DNA binding CopG/RHH family protein
MPGTWLPLRYEVRPKGRSINLPLSEDLLSAIKSRAAEEGVPYQRFIRMALEDALARERRRA